MKHFISLLDDLPKSVSSLEQSKLIQDRVAQVKFDWNNAQEVLQVLRDEINELEEAINNQADHVTLQDEFGDIIFTCVNLARHLNTTIDTALLLANQKFSRRFRQMEHILQKRHLEIEQLNFTELLECWQQAKKDLNQNE